MLVDTSALIAYFSDAEEHHRGVVTAVDRLLSDGETLDLLDTVLEETLSVVRKRVSRKQAIRVARALIEQPIITLISLTTDAVIETTKLFIKHRGRYSYVDCSLAVAANERHETILLTLDKHFREFQLRSIP